MSWLGRLFQRRPVLGAEQALALAAYRSHSPVPASSPLETLRFVVADVETTGLNPFADQLISIGAVEILDSRILLRSGFEIVFRQSRASANANILIHGIDGTAQMEGVEPAAASLLFLDYAKNAPLVGFHADFDRVMIDRAFTKAIGYAPSNTWLDLAYLAPAVLPEPDRRLPRGLDEWMDRFDIVNLSRHNALSDALATAQLLQVVLAEAVRQGITTLAGLIKLEQNQRWLRNR